MFVRILNSEMELATGCTEPGAVALTAAEAGAALRKAGGTRVEAVTVRASINIIKNAMSAGIPGTSYQGMDYAAAIGAVGGDPVHLLEVMNYVPREQMEEAAALVKAGKVKVEVAQVPQKLYVEVLVTSDGHTGRAVVRVNAQCGLEGRDRRVITPHVVVGGAQVVVERRRVADASRGAREGARRGGIVAGLQAGAALLDGGTAVPTAAGQQQEHQACACARRREKT